MSFDNEVLYGRDDDMDEYGEGGAYGEDEMEEDYDLEDDDDNIVDDNVIFKFIICFLLLS